LQCFTHIDYDSPKFFMDRSDMDSYTKQRTPIIMNKTQAEIDAAIDRIRKSGLSKEDADLFIGAAEFAIWFPQALKEKDISIKNLRRALFGETNPKKKKKNNKKENDSNNLNQSAELNNQNILSSENNESAASQPLEPNQNSNVNVIDMEEAKSKKQGHGRMGFDAYPDCKQVFVSHTTLKVGDFCPEQCGGKLYSLSPGIVVRIDGNPLATVTNYRVETLRCALCSFVFKADLPEGVSKTEKYNELFKANLAIQKYFAAMPFYRQETLQAMLDFRLPDSTQFDLVEQVADCAYPVIGALEEMAANGELLNFDDTNAKILSVIAHNKQNPNKERSGMFTTGFVAKTSDNHAITLFYTSTKHAGENLATLLEKRIESEKKINAMCDALSRNVPESLQDRVVEINCLAHGFRKFRDVLDYYPEFCLHVIQELGKIYENEDATVDMSIDDRMTYHQKHSRPIMDDLRIYLERQFKEKLIEPNSHLGKAITYMTKRWEKFTRFYTLPGTPIDNNLAERVLKIPIRIRKSAMFYRTQHGARISDILLSLIETARQCKVNPAHYLVSLQKNKSAVHKNSADWVPWQYRTTLEKMHLQIAA
jgi:transposase